MCRATGRSKPRWLWWLLAGLVLATLGGGAAIVALPTSCSGRQQDLTNARALEAAAEIYMAEHASCPSVADLLRYKIIHAKHRVLDKWGNPFEIVCADGEPRIESAGSDRVRGTNDDLNPRAAQ